MSGRKHHYIPRFLQKGFASRISGKQAYAWVFKRIGDPFESNTEGIGAERDFYTRDGNSEADEIITRQEIEFNDTLNRLKGGDLSNVDVQKICELIIHFQTRTKWIREIFEKDSHSLFARVVEHFKTDEYIERFIDVMITNGSGPINRELGKISSVYRSLGLSKNAARKLMIDYQRKSRAELATAMKIWIENMWLRTPRIFAEAVKNAHINAQKAEISDSERLKAYSQLDFRILHSASAKFILSDCIVVSMLKSPPRYTAIWSREESLDAIALPISSTACLIGSFGICDISEAQINIGSARLADQFFISSQ
ncbi:MAG: DUF4238 domain-containing protein [Fibrobacterota bacterium]|nr:MAG: DUF4238 domain-containing protein [Fibrobacterota bacterium]